MKSKLRINVLTKKDDDVIMEKEAIDIETENIACILVAAIFGWGVVVIETIFIVFLIYKGSI
jgi:hypothetical protein